MALWGMPLVAGDAVQARRLIADPHTLENVGLRWYIEGDDNRNATVTVEYRKTGEARWRAGQPMLRAPSPGFERGHFELWLAVGQNVIQTPPEGAPSWDWGTIRVGDEVAHC